MIGWYLHHHGLGHLQRLRAIAPHLRRDLVVFSSVPRPRDEDAPEISSAVWVSLPPDWRSSRGLPAERADPTAGGALHWAPLANDGYRERMVQLAAWAPRLDALVVDVSAEVVMLGRLLGVPTIAMTQPGRRTDAPHRTALGMATAVIAPFIEPLPGEPSAALLELGDRVTFTGGISLLDGRGAGEDATRATAEPASARANAATHVPESDSAPTAAPAAPPVRVTLVGSRGGFAITPADVAATAAATPFAWHALGLEGAHWAADIAAELAAADVAVIGAGLGSVADAAALGVPAVVVPQPRPFDEQRATAVMLERLGIVTTPSWPEPGAWTSLVERALRAGAAPWVGWRTAGAAERAAAVVERVAGKWGSRGGVTASSSPTGAGSGS